MLKRSLAFKLSFSEVAIFFFLAFLGMLLSLDLFLRSGRPITYDGPTHLTTIAQFGLGLKEKQFPVTWSDSFATFGLPIPLLAQQVTSYLGGVFYLFSHNVILSYNLVVVTGVIASGYLTYRFFRTIVKQEAAFLGSLLFMFAPYRIANIYVRGALPELFAGVWIPLILWGIVVFLRDNRKVGLVNIWVGCFFLILTHPMMLLPTGLVAGPLALFYLWHAREAIWQKILLGMMTVVLAFTATAYYLLPLVLEIKYFYYGQVASHYNDNHFLSWRNFLLPSWPYYTADAIGPRPQWLILGSLEMALMVAAALGLVFLAVTQRKNTRWKLLGLVFSLGVVIILLTTSLARPLYLHTSLFSNMQHPWRFLTILIFIPPFLLALLSDRLPRKLLPFLTVGMLLFVIFNRFPQMYGKNYMMLPTSAYEATRDNLHGTYLNTIWSGEISDYPVKTTQLSIIGGQAELSDVSIKNAQRSYTINALTETRMVDFTFYFPGWKVFVDGQPVTIEFQDPSYRGLITYTVPAGQHQVRAVFGDTKVRLLGKLVTVFALIVSSLFFIILRKVGQRYAKMAHTSQVS